MLFIMLLPIYLFNQILIDQLGRTYKITSN